MITPRNAMVSMVRKKDSKHAFLVIESIQDNYYIIRRADFVIDKREKHSIGIISTGQALIEIAVKSLVDMQELAGQCVYKSWAITEDQVYGLLANLEADRIKPIDYLNLGKDSFFYKKSNNETHSCLTWCEEHLSKIGIDVSEQTSWFDAIAADPMSRLPDRKTTFNIQSISTLSEADKKDEEPDSKQNCLVM